MKSQTLTASSLAGLLLFTLLGATFAMAQPATTPNLQCNNPDSTLLWKVSGEGAQAHLFGTYHLGEASFYPLAEPVEEAFRNADSLVFEVDPGSMTSPDSMMKLQQRALLPSDTQLTDFVSPSVVEELKQTLNSMQLPADNFLRFRPWFISLNLTSLQMVSMGYMPQFGVESYLYREKPADVEIKQLESLDEQLDFMEELDGEAFLAYTLEEFERSKEQIQASIDAWRCADKDALETLLTESFDAEGPVAEELAHFQDTFLYQRNQTMADEIADFLENGNGEYFVAVGAAHFIGDKSIIDYLEQQGFTVEAVAK